MCMFRLLPGCLQQMQSSCEKLDVYYMGELQIAWIVGRFENVETWNGILMKKVFRMFKILTTKYFFQNTLKIQNTNHLPKV